MVTLCLFTAAISARAVIAVVAFVICTTVDLVVAYFVRFIVDVARARFGSRAD